MTPEAQRIAIAEACRIEPLVKFESVNGRYVKIEGSEDWTGCPDYLNDLNAMHEAEKVLTHQQHFQFATQLFKLVRSTIENERIDPLVISATAPQRAEAFLRTLGLWKS